LKIGALTGTSIWSLGVDAATRAATVEALNQGQLHGIVMTDQVGACGHTLTGANVMIFIGSLYSPTQEGQAIGNFHSPLHSLMTGRMCRQGQTKQPVAVIIADPEFSGDKTAFIIKKRRFEEDQFLHCPFNAIDPELVKRSWWHHKAIFGSQADFARWCTWEQNRIRKGKAEARLAREARRAAKEIDNTRA
jgi:hypothetical protein